MAARKDGLEEGRFRVRPGSPKSRPGPRSPRLISQVLKEVSRAGTKASGSQGVGPASTFGRGRVAAGIAGQRLGRNARRVVIKSRFVVLKKAGARSVSTHLRYIERDGTTRDGRKGQAYGPDTDTADLQAFEERGKGDRHQFRFIVSAEDAEELEDLRDYTRTLMARMAIDLETRLDWVAVDHWDTDNPHTHVVLRGRSGEGRGADLVIAPDYMAHGMRRRACELATEWLGPRTELEIRRSLQREVEQERWTSLDRTLQRESVGGRLSTSRLNEPRLQHQRQLLIGRLLRLQRMGLAGQVEPGTWAISAGAQKTLRALGERGDIVRAMHQLIDGESREMVVFEPGKGDPTVVGRVADKGFGGEAHDRSYLVVDGIDGRFHYVALTDCSNLEEYPKGAVVEVRGLSKVKVIDQDIVALASDGLYRTDHHFTVARGQAKTGRDPRGVVEASVRRLEALRSAGIVEHVAEGLWKVPDDLPEQGRIHDAQRLGGVAVELKSRLPIERQVHAMGATWLDQQLICGDWGLDGPGFGSDVKEALQQRRNFLEEQGLAERCGHHVVLARSLLATLRDREVTRAAQYIAAETGLVNRTVSDGQPIAGIYRRSVMLVSGRYAMLEDGVGFSLVPWNPAIGKRLGQRIAAKASHGGASRELFRERGPAI